MSRSTSHSVILSTLLIAALLILSACGLRDRDQEPPTVPPSQTQSNPTALPEQPAVPIQPTSEPTEEADTAGDEIQAEMDQLDKDNQSADTLDDLP